eukprot:NODE_147_length_15617_cov_0.576750.p2 type:complete len:334 gc:universal NODE_147_length_15617_cov_0.576750:5820-6821(+)
MVDFENDVFSLKLVSNIHYNDYLNGLKDALNDLQQYIQINKKIQIIASIIPKSGTQLGATAPASQYTIYNTRYYNIPSALSPNNNLDIVAEFYHQDQRWTFDGGNYDFKAIATHEMLHGLGFYSNVEPFYQYFGLYTSTTPKTALQPIFLPPTDFDMHIYCNNIPLYQLLLPFLNICVPNTILLNHASMVIQAAAYVMVGDTHLNELQNTLSIPNNCQFQSKSVNFTLFTGTNMKQAILSHTSQDSNPVLMRPKYPPNINYQGINPYQLMLNELGYHENQSNHEFIFEMPNCSQIMNETHLQLAQSRLDNGDFQSDATCLIYLQLIYILINLI